MSFSILLLLVTNLHGQTTYGGIKLLKGYKYEKQLIIDGEAGKIYKKNGLVIEFESGYSQGYVVNESEINKYLWLKKQTIHNQEVLIALVKQNVKTVWEPEKPRNRKFGNILLVTYPLSNQTNHALNFRAEILNNEELIDALLMVLTFDRHS